MASRIRVEVAYATPEKQKIVACQVDSGASPREVLRISEIAQYFPDIDLENCEIGVFGKVVPEDYELSEGDRIEIYRPLIADPKEIRRQRAAMGLKTRKGGGAVSPD